MLEPACERYAMLMCVFMRGGLFFFFLCTNDFAHVCARCRGMRSSVRSRETDSGLSHVRSSCMYSSEPGERLSEQVNNHI